MDDDDLLAFEAFVIPEGDLHPGAMYEQLIELDEHAHFKEHDIPVEFLLRIESKVKNGRRELGRAMIPTVQGELKSLFEQLLSRWLGRMPHFLIILDAEFWREADDVTRLALLEHEMCHIKQEIDKFGEPKFDRDGNPVFGIMGHDLEEFNYIVRKYGSWKGDIAAFLGAAAEHK